MEEEHAHGDAFLVLLIASFFPYIILFILLCLVFASFWLDSCDGCECCVSRTTTVARPQESKQLSSGKKEIPASIVDPDFDWEGFQSLWIQEDVGACSPEDDAIEVGSDEEETSEGGREREIEEMGDEVSDSNDEDEDDDDGWEVIERRQLGIEYERAVRFMESEKNDEGTSKLRDDEKLRFYGFHKVAVEGPCQEPQPAPFNLSARAKWNAWRRLGCMSPEDAVEQYIDLLQEKFPDWRKDSLVVSTAGDRDRDPK